MHIQRRDNAQDVKNTASSLPTEVLGGLIGGAVLVVIFFILGWVYCVRPALKEKKEEKERKKNAAVSKKEEGERREREAIQITVDEPKEVKKDDGKEKKRVQIAEPDEKPAAAPETLSTQLAAIPESAPIQPAIEAAANAAAAKAEAAPITSAVVSIPVAGVSRTITERKTQGASYESTDFEHEEEVEPVQ
ncbi:hypothetical protein HDU97_000976 [Phlyctochytrium planicorne]|nr:hypothetical protein HDU97_000976 [Phlyctochytrium planicorne]